MKPLISLAAAYDEVAEQYDALVQHDVLIHALVIPRLLDMLEPIKDQAICDLACGQGVVARALAQSGARVVGVDLSARMLAIAEGYERADPLGIRYLLEDAQTLTRLADASFDAVLCCLAITDIVDMQTTASAVSRILRPGGLFVYALPHPCFQAPGSRWLSEEQQTVALVRGYFREGAWSSDQQFSGRLGGYHRMLSTLLNLLTQAGLLYEQAVEPQAFLPHKPGYSEVPVAFVARHRKGAPP